MNFDVKISDVYLDFLKQENQQIKKKPTTATS
jgi:hypothetical protein